MSPSIKPLPLISVIMPTLNSISCVERALLSVANQRYRNVEIIVIDGGSTDGTVEFVKANAANVSCWLSEQDRGPYDAMNKGVALAQGDWIYFLGCDDLLVNCLHKIFSKTFDNNSLIYGDVYWKSKNRTYDGEFSWYKLIRKNVCQQAIFYPRSLLIRHQFNLRYRVLADWDLNLKLWSDSQIEKVYVSELVGIYGGGGLSAQVTDEAFLIDKAEIVNRLFGRRLAVRDLYENLLHLIFRASRKLNQNN